VSDYRYGPHLFLTVVYFIGPTVHLMQTETYHRRQKWNVAKLIRSRNHNNI